MIIRNPRLQRHVAEHPALKRPLSPHASPLGLAPKVPFNEEFFSSLLGSLGALDRLEPSAKGLRPLAEGAPRAEQLAPSKGSGVVGPLLRAGRKLRDGLKARGCDPGVPSLLCAPSACARALLGGARSSAAVLPGRCSRSGHPRADGPPHRESCGLPSCARGGTRFSSSWSLRPSLCSSRWTTTLLGWHTTFAPESTARRHRSMSSKPFL